MMRPKSIRIAVAAAVMVFAGTTASAQNVSGKIPFPFYAAGVAMPAGTYELNRLDGVLTGWRLNNKSSHTSDIILTRTGATMRPARERGKSMLVFQCAGDNCALQSIYTAGNLEGHAFPFRLPRVSPNLQISTIRVALGD